MFTGIIKNLLQIIVLLFWRNYYGYVILLPITSCAANIILAVCARNMYPQYVCLRKSKTTISKEIKGKVMALFAVKNNECYLQFGGQYCDFCVFGSSGIGEI